MDDPDQWRYLGVHWHAYVEVRHPGDTRERSDRADRLARRPEEVRLSPDAAVEWLIDMARRHGHRQRVKLMEPDSRWAYTYDEEHLGLNAARDRLTLSAGLSLYTDVQRQTDRLYLWLEAVTAETCAEVHDEQE